MLPVISRQNQTSKTNSFHINNIPKRKILHYDKFSLKKKRI